ncbi:MAG: selenocysteine-specific translation elongation factor [Proteocatella sp.]
MKHIIVGTAGHIDHGKTTLIKALTGINTDRLEEEQKRGISIDLGFSHFDISEDERIGIIDVPGHEKFLKNMLAGVAGMDLVMLVVAADEGVMPQTKEHLDILDLIGLKKGIIVITKIDNVEEDFLPLVEDDIRGSVEGTFLENAPCVHVDSISKKGLDDLISLIKKMSEEVDGRDENAPVRMYIDRIFSVKGFGSVVTGTLVEGTIKPDDELVVYPKELKAKVRGVQVHSKPAKAAYAGQRVAINLSNIEKDKLERGDILAEVNSMSPTMMIDCKIRVIKEASKDIEHWDRVRLYHGAREILGRIVPLEGNIIQRGHEGYAQIRLEEKLACKSLDKIVIRTYSPMETIGGGVILDANPKKHSAADENLVEALQIKEEGSPKDVIENYLKSAKDFVSIPQIVEKLTLSQDLIKSQIEELKAENKVVIVGGPVIHLENFETIIQKGDEVLSQYHKQNPLKQGMSREEFKSRLGLKLKPKEYDVFLEELMKLKDIVLNQSIIKLKDFEIVYTPEKQKLKDEIMNRLQTEGMTPSLVKDYIDTKEKEEVIEGLLEEQLIVRVSEDLIYDKKVVDKFQEEIREFIQINKAITMNDFRDKYGLSRKFTIALLDYFDRIKLTRRVGDKRLLF